MTFLQAKQISACFTVSRPNPLHSPLRTSALMPIVLSQYINTINRLNTKLYSQISMLLAFAAKLQMSDRGLSRKAAAGTV